MKEKIGIICRVDGIKHIREVGHAETLCGQSIRPQRPELGLKMVDSDCNKCRKVVGLPPVK